MSAKALGSICYNWSWCPQAIQDKMLMNSTNSKKNWNCRMCWFLGPKRREYIISSDTQIQKRIICTI